jgi:hypothetical protein
MKRLHKLLPLQIFFILSISQLLAQSESSKGFGTELPLGVKSSDIIHLIVPNIDT